MIRTDEQQNESALDVNSAIPLTRLRVLILHETQTGPYFQSINRTTASMIESPLESQDQQELELGTQTDDSASFEQSIQHHYQVYPTDPGRAHPHRQSRESYSRATDF